MQKRGIYVVVMATKPPASSDAKYTEEIRKVFFGLHSIAFLAPVYPYTLEGIVGNDEMTLADGYHPNARGVDVMVRGVYKMVEDGLRWKQGIIKQIAKQQH